MSWIQTYRKRRVDSNGEEVRLPSVTSNDVISITPSQNNGPTSLTISLPTSKYEEICRSEPITTCRKVKQILKMLSIIMIPVVVLTGITANTFCITLGNYAKSTSIRNTLVYSVRLGQVIHSLQEERDTSALYLSSIQKKTKSLLLQQYVKTDLSLEDFRFSTSGPNLIRNEFQSKDNFLSFLNSHRYELDRRDQTVDMELQFYTTLIRVFIVWLYDAVTEDQTGPYWPNLVAYQEVVLAKEYMGLERALGTVFYADGRFPSRFVYLWFSESQDVATATILSARRYSDVVHDLYEKNIYKNKKLLENLNSMRAEIRRNDLGGSSTLDMAQWWFDNMTQYMDLLLVIQQQLAVEVTKMQDKGQRANLGKMYVISAMCICVVFISIIIVYVIYFLMNISQKYSVCIQQRSIALKKQRRHTQKLMYQLLPKTIADMMKRNEEVVGKNYPDVTVFFSDMQDFNEISSRSSPIQVIQMINKMCAIFNDILKENDVCKIETIGDAYLITSGVPTSNRDDHAAAICRMALKLTKKVKQVEIPHLPAQMYKLRIGCHSGSVVAVVAGVNIPRYCLLGETVAIASRIKSLGENGQIHISEMTYESLPVSDEFILVERFDDNVKEELKTVPGINGRTRTYWLNEPRETAGTPNSSI